MTKRIGRLVMIYLETDDTPDAPDRFDELMADVMERGDLHRVDEPQSGKLATDNELWIAVVSDSAPEGQD